MILTQDHIYGYVKLSDCQNSFNVDTWLKVMKINNYDFEVRNEHCSYSISNNGSRILEYTRTLPKKLEFKDIKIGMWIKLKDVLANGPFRRRWVEVERLMENGSPWSSGFEHLENEIEDISETDPKRGIFKNSNTTIQNEDKENKENNMVSENHLKELENIKEENLAKAKKLADEELATRQQKRASDIYKEILNEVEELDVTIKNATERKTVLKEALKKYSK